MRVCLCRVITPQVALLLVLLIGLLMLAPLADNTIPQEKVASTAEEDDASIEAVPDDVRPARTATTSQRSQTGRRDKKRTNRAVESAKSKIIREFVASHGDQVSKSRKHADLFDGSGYLIDMMKELHHYESRAEDEKVKGHQHRQKRSTIAKEGNANDEHKLPHFASLSEAFAHMNNGHQKETISPDFNVRFFDDEEGNDRPESESEPPRRRKRSLGNPDDDEEDGDDADWWLRDDDGPQGYNEAEQEARRQREAAESMARLDADLKEIAKYLDDQAAEEQQQQVKEQQRQGENVQAALPNPLGNFNRRMTAAYKSLVKLKDMAQDALSSDNPEPQPLKRIQDLYLEKTASWRIDAEALEETLRDLKKYYRSIDEL